MSDRVGMLLCQVSEPTDSLRQLLSSTGHFYLPLIFTSKVQMTALIVVNIKEIEQHARVNWIRPYQVWTKIHLAMSSAKCFRLVGGRSWVTFLRYSQQGLNNYFDIVTRCLLWSKMSNLRSTISSVSRGVLPSVSTLRPTASLRLAGVDWETFPSL